MRCHPKRSHVDYGYNVMQDKSQFSVLQDERPAGFGQKVDSLLINYEWFVDKAYISAAKELSKEHENTGMSGRYDAFTRSLLLSPKKSLTEAEQRFFSEIRSLLYSFAGNPDGYAVARQDKNYASALRSACVSIDLLSKGTGQESDVAIAYPIVPNKNIRYPSDGTAPEEVNKVPKASELPVLDPVVRDASSGSKASSAQKDDSYLQAKIKLMWDHNSKKGIIRKISGYLFGSDDDGTAVSVLTHLAKNCENAMQARYMLLEDQSWMSAKFGSDASSVRKVVKKNRDALVSILDSEVSYKSSAAKHIHEPEFPYRKAKEDDDRAVLKQKGRQEARSGSASLDQIMDEEKPVSAVSDGSVRQRSVGPLKVEGVKIGGTGDGYAASEGVEIIDLTDDNVYAGVTAAPISVAGEANRSGFHLLSDSLNSASGANNGASGASNGASGNDHSSGKIGSGKASGADGSGRKDPSLHEHDTPKEGVRQYSPDCLGLRLCVDDKTYDIWCGFLNSLGVDPEHLFRGPGHDGYSLADVLSYKSLESLPKSCKLEAGDAKKADGTETLSQKTYRLLEDLIYQRVEEIRDQADKKVHPVYKDPSDEQPRSDPQADGKDTYAEQREYSAHLEQALREILDGSDRGRCQHKPSLPDEVMGLVCRSYEDKPGTLGYGFHVRTANDFVSFVTTLFNAYGIDVTRIPSAKGRSKVSIVDVLNCRSLQEMESLVGTSSLESLIIRGYLHDFRRSAGSDEVKLSRTLEDYRYDHSIAKGSSSSDQSFFSRFIENKVWESALAVCIAGAVAVGAALYSHHQGHESAAPYDKKHDSISMQAKDSRSAHLADVNGYSGANLVKDQKASLPIAVPTPTPLRAEDEVVVFSAPTQVQAPLQDKVDLAAAPAAAGVDYSSLPDASVITKLNELSAKASVHQTVVQSAKDDMGWHCIEALNFDSASLSNGSFDGKITTLAKYLRDREDVVGQVRIKYEDGSVQKRFVAPDSKVNFSLSGDYHDVKELQCRVGKVKNINGSADVRWFASHVKRF